MVHSPYISKSVDTNDDRIKVEQLMQNDSVYKQYKDL